MALINVEKIGELGVIVDRPDHSLPPEAWSNASNVRFHDGKVSKVQGEEDVFDTPLINPHFLLPWRLTTVYRWLYANGTKIAYTTGTTSTDVTRYTTTPGDNDYSGGARPIWTGGILHGVPVLNHNNISDYPQQWDDSISRFKDLDNWPTDTYCQVLRPFKNFLVALDITKASNRYHTLVKWSHPANAGAVPVSWDETDATKLAGEYPVAQTGGFLIDCLPLQSSNILYKSDSIWSMTPTGGLDVFRFAPISQTIGMLTARCGTEFMGQHFVVGTNDIYLFNGSRPQSLVSRRLRRWFFTNLSDEHFDKTLVVPNFPKQEIWICYVEAGNSSEYLNKALIWNWVNNTWTIKDLPEISYLAYGQVHEPSDIFDAASGSFDTDFGAFGAAGVSPAELQLLQARTYGTASFLHGDEGYDSQGNPYVSIVERTGLAIAGKDRQGNLIVDPSQRKFLRAVYPKVVSPGGVVLKISVGGQEVPGGPITWQPAQMFNSETDTRITCALNTKYMALRIEDQGTVPWEFSGYALDLDVIGVL